MNKPNIIPVETISQKIFIMRGVKVMLDADLAELYQVPTKRLNEQIKRNHSRFPEDFMFQLTKEEFMNLRSQFATSSLAPIQSENDGVISSQVLGKTQSPAGLQGRADRTHGGRRYLPWAFTEHGAVFTPSAFSPARGGSSCRCRASGWR